MLDLDSPVWDSLAASPGGSGRLAADLIRQIRGGDDSAFAELYHQLCHQFTVGLVAYVAVPHLVDIARAGGRGRVVAALGIVGTVVAAGFAHPGDLLPLPAEWEAEYLAANEEAMGLTADALRQSGWERPDSQQLLATLAAFHGHSDLAIHLFLHAGVTELSCPVCGEPITFGDRLG